MKSIDRLQEYVEKAPRTSISLMARSILLGMVRTIEQEVEDELKAKDGRMWLRGYGECHAQLVEGNDVIAEDLEKAGWVKLPVDADGVPIHVGDAMEADNGTTFEVEHISLYPWGWRCVGEGTDRSGVTCTAHAIPDGCRHHHAPTVEDVLREFLDALDIDRCVDPDATIAEFAKRLRLAGEE